MLLSKVNSDLCLQTDQISVYPQNLTLVGSLQGTLACWEGPGPKSGISILLRRCHGASSILPPAPRRGEKRRQRHWVHYFPREYSSAPALTAALMPGETATWVISLKEAVLTSSKGPQSQSREIPQRSKEETLHYFGVSSNLFLVLKSDCCYHV